MNKRERALYPIYFAALYVLVYFVQTQLYFDPPETCLPLIGLSVGCVATLHFALSLLLRSANKAALIAFLTVCAFWTVITLKPFVQFLPDLTLLVQVYWTLIFCGIIFAIAVRAKLTKFTAVMNKLGLWAICVQLAIVAYHELEFNVILRPRLKLSYLEKQGTVWNSSKPDIYYIILDGHASDKVFSQYYKHNSHEFSEFLLSNGFVIPPSSHSNYGLTELSLSSSLNMQLINPISQVIGSNRNDYCITNMLIRDNAVQRFLKRRGYRTINISSGFGPTYWNPYADLNVGCRLLTWNSVEVLFGSLVGVFAPDLLFNEMRESQRTSIDMLEQYIAEAGPKFVFAHILLPHPPYLFNADGAPIKPKGLIGWDGNRADLQAYLDQATYTQRQMMHFIKRLRRKSTEAVVIIQGDHGGAFTGSACDRNPSDSYIAERLGILNAYLLPGVDPSSIYSTITPVNSFRVIFNQYFGTRYPLLEDKSYISSYVSPFLLTDVTSKLLHPLPTTLFSQHARTPDYGKRNEGIMTLRDTKDSKGSLSITTGPQS